LQDLLVVGEGGRPDMALLQGEARPNVGMGAVRRVPGLSREKIGTRRMIDGLCNGDLNSEARKHWSCEMLQHLSAWADDPEMGPFLDEDEKEQTLAIMRNC
jgi:hypothetical protein